jgi:hypothetical protein
MHIFYRRAIQRLALSLACLLAGDLLICIFVGIMVKSLDAIFVGLLYAVAFSVTIWMCGLWIAILAIPVAAQLSWWVVPLAGVHAIVAGFLIWEYRNRGAVLFPPRTLFDFWQVGLLHAFSAILYTLCLRRMATSFEIVRT